MSTWERILHYLALLFVVFSVLGELFFPSTLRFILDDLFFPFGMLFLGVSFLKNPNWRWLIVSFLALMAWGLLSDILSNGIRTAPIGMLLRWAKWPIMFVAMAELSKLAIQRKQVLNSIVILFFALIALNLVMMINPIGLGQKLSELFSSRADVLLSNYHEFGAFRLSGTMMNPNNNAILFGLFLLFFLHVDPRRYWKYILMAFILIFLTQSRTVMLVSLAIFALYVLRMNSRKVNLMLIPAGIVLLIGGLFFFRSRNLLSIFNGTAFQSNSWTSRMDHYSILFKSEGSDLFVGHGIVLDPIGSVGFSFDSEYLSIGYQYGLIGLLIWMIIIGIVVKTIRKTNRESTFGLTILLFILGVASTNFIFLNVECATLLMTLIGAWIFLQRDCKLNNHSKEEAR